MDRLRERPAWSMTGSEKLSALDQLQADLTRLSTRRLELLASLDTDGYATELGAGNTINLIAIRHRLDATEVRRDLKLAHALPKYTASPTPTAARDTGPVPAGDGPIDHAAQPTRGYADPPGQATRPLGGFAHPLGNTARPHRNPLPTSSAATSRAIQIPGLTVLSQSRLPLAGCGIGGGLWDRWRVVARYRANRLSVVRQPVSGQTHGGRPRQLPADGGWEDAGAGDGAFGLADHAAEAGFSQFYG
jgi:hypothetical protein